MMIPFCVSVFWIALLASPARAEGGHPAALDTRPALPLAAEARRVHLLGAVEIYSVALYADAPLSNRAQLVAAEVPKALRIEVTYGEEWRGRITLDWRRELVPALDPAPTTHLRLTFAGLKLGDVVLIEYAPGKGTSIRLNKSVVASGANHDLMLAFLDHWLGQRPVSEEMKRTLVGSS
jgi:hypothetical protein